MPWYEATRMSLRYEFITLAQAGGSTFSQLCRRFGISRKTGYKWLARYHVVGIEGLADASRRPRCSPGKTSRDAERAVLAIRTRHTTWGGRKIARRLRDLGWRTVPAASTITAILKRAGHITPEESRKHQPWTRFEAVAPNDLWQMDFKGHIEIPGGRCHPLTALDDHSRFSLVLQACADETRDTVRGHLIEVFRRYGLPRQMLFDNGPPWGSDAEHSYTLLTVWLMRLRIGVIHSQPHHPQTLGKEERFHRTLKADVLQYCTGEEMDVCQQRFDAWREVYNLHRPHEALGMAVPASRYCLSSRQFPEELPPIEYGPDDQVRKVQQGGMLNYRGKEFRVSKAFYGQPVALRPTQVDGILNVVFCDQKIHQIDLRK